MFYAWGRAGFSTSLAATVSCCPPPATEDWPEGWSDAGACCWAARALRSRRGMAGAGGAIRRTLHRSISTMMEFPVIPTPNPAKVARMMDITACKWSCKIFVFFRITDSAQCTRWSCNLICSDIEATWIWWGNVCTGLICAYISVKQMGEEHDEEELYCRVDPNVSSCHCNDVWIMDPLQQNQALQLCGVQTSGWHSYPCLSLSMMRRAPGYMRRAAILPAQQCRHGPPVSITNIVPYRRESLAN